MKSICRTLRNTFMVAAWGLAGLCLSQLCLAQNTPAGTQTPVIFNAPLSTRPGDIVGLQGANFGEEPVITLHANPGMPAQTLPVHSKFESGWVSFKVPDTATGALVVMVSNGSAHSTPIALNSARAFHLDAMQLVPKGAFKVFGRNLRVQGYEPRLLVDGLAAQVDVRRSNEHMLVATAPQQLKPTTSANITVDNGNGTGPSVLARKIEVVRGNADPFGLGVGWGAGFGAIATRTITVACSGVADDTPALQTGVDQLASSGGGVLQLPEGECRLAGSLRLRSQVVLQGAGKDLTLLKYEANYPLLGRALSMANTKGRIESPLLQNSDRVFFQNVRFSLAGGVQMFLTGNKNFVVMGCDFLQPKNPWDNGPYHMAANAGLVFMGNTTTFANGSPSFARTHDAYIAHNRFTRDARDNQLSKGVVHSFAMDFAYRIAVVGNTFDVLGCPITNKTRNDGETLLTEGGAGSRTENLGTVATATLSTLTDPDNTITNTQGEWASYVTLRFVRTDATDFGLGTIGIEVRGNTITANHPNISLPHEEVADREGYTNRMHAEGPTQAVAKNQTRLLGTIFQNNQCNRCKTPLLIRDGAKATVLDSNLSTLAIE